ncbi:AraC family transcriptional regulator [Paenibacillus sp. BR2-3]|uniref:AraC family transcriptional regulator n=1 Tax=Paenibacillus sp. BR2-3 TaxID=3048494 RepID=UPI00397767EB
MLAINVEFIPKIKLMGFISYTNPWIHFKRNTNEHVLYFIKSGELHMQENGVSYVLKKGDIFMLEPNLDHEGTAPHVCDYYYIHFEHPDIQSSNPADLLTLAKEFILEGQTSYDAPYSSVCHFPKRYTLSDKKSLHQTLHAMNEMLQLYKRKHFNRSLTALKFSELLIEVSREYVIHELQQHTGNNTKSVVKVHALLDYIHGHYASKITSADIEQEFECNYDYINRIFTKVTGHPIMRYVNVVRINHAKELIEATHLSFSEIGYLTGLNDPFYFSKVFKKFVGLSPIQYYKEIRKKD